jgi:hypothetical protein
MGMRNRRSSEIARFLVVCGLAAGSFGADCSGEPVPASALPCAANVAEIAIWDGKIQKLCGCGGVDGEFASSGYPLSCTFKLGTNAFVYYNGPFLQHQFVAVGLPALPNGPVFDPDAKNPIRAHAFTPDATGTYNFKDEYDGTILGTIVVTP